MAWKENSTEGLDDSVQTSDVYDLPFGMGSKFCAAKWFKYLPMCPDPPIEHNSSAYENSNKMNTARDIEMSVDTKI